MPLDINKTIAEARDLLQKESQISPAFRAMFEMLLVIVAMLAQRLGLSSKNSSKPPSIDPNRLKKGRSKSGKKPGGQTGHIGSTLLPVNNPDIVVDIAIDTNTLPAGEYNAAGYEARQVVELKICKEITEYRAQILQDSAGKNYVAAFPSGVNCPIQYGKSLKVHSVYLSQAQLLPYGRVQDYFVNTAKIPISTGTICNFNQEAYELLATFDAIAKEKLRDATLLHADETSINVNGKRIWLHNASNEQWTYFFPHNKRGTEAMNAIDILPQFKGVLVHDHWKPYFTYECRHALCNAHHIRELEWVIEHYPAYTWAKSLQDLLREINKAVDDQPAQKLGEAEAAAYHTCYRQIIAIGLQETPAPTDPPAGAKKKGRVKKSKALNLLERLRDFEVEVLRFMVEAEVPFTNNRGENDIRMTKVQQKISGCFKSLGGAETFCRVRSYLLTAQKHGITHAEALQTLFDGKLPAVLGRSR